MSKFGETLKKKFQEKKYQLIKVKSFDPTKMDMNDVHQIVWFERASGTVSIDQKEFELSNRNVITVGKKQDFKWNVLETKGIAVSFADSDFPASSVDSVCRIVLLYNYFNIHNQIVIEENQKEEFDQLFHLMLSEYELNHSNLKNPVLSLLIQTVLLKIERFIRTNLIEDSIKNSEDEIILNQFLNNLEENFNQEHQVKYYAEKLNITTRKLNDITKTYLATTTKDLIINRVYIEILKKLQFTSKTIKEIAYQIGFSSPYHLTNFFTKINGNSPLIYRKKL